MAHAVWSPSPHAVGLFGVDTAFNRAVYGSGVGVQDILTGKARPPPEFAPVYALLATIAPPLDPSRSGMDHSKRRPSFLGRAYSQGSGGSGGEGPVKRLSAAAAADAVSATQQAQQAQQASSQSVGGGAETSGEAGAGRTPFEVN